MGQHQGVSQFITPCGEKIDRPTDMVIEDLWLIEQPPAPTIPEWINGIVFYCAFLAGLQAGIQNLSPCPEMRLVTGDWLKL